MSIRHGRGLPRRLALIPFVALALAAGPALAAEADAPQVQLVKHLDGTLLDVMRNAKQLGFKGRYAKLEPLVQQVFDVRLMTQVAVGSGWNELTDDQRAELVKAFGQFIAATYADRFDGYSGEKFVESGQRPYGTGTLVQTQLVKSDGEPVALDYVTHENDGNWQVVDVYMTGTISELATRRSEFSAVFHRAGYEGLLQSLQEKVAQIKHQSEVG